MRTVGKARRMVLLVTGLIVAACSDYARHDDPEIQDAMEKLDVPLVAGNTFDYWNQLEKISPESAIININYQYLFNQETRFSVPDVFESESWIYEERDEQHPKKSLFISVKNESGEATDPAGRVLVFGRHQFVSTAYCFDSRDAQAEEVLLPYISYFWNRNAGLPGPLLVHRFTARDREADGTRLELVHIQDIQSVDRSCAEIGNLEEPSEETADLLSRLYTIAQRSFEVIG